jgi:hypothetical protein
VQSTEKPLSKRERAELQGYVSTSAIAGRAALFLLALVVLGAVSRRAQQWFQLPDPSWLLPTVLVGILLYVRARRWTGGQELRRQIRLDLAANTALVHHIQARDALLFEEQEDEGPVVIVLTDSGETLAFVGQDLARHVARGFPWRQFEIREAAHSRRFLGFERRGDPLPPSTVKPPLSWAQYNQLGLASGGRWQRIDIPFDHFRHVA